MAQSHGGKREIKTTVIVAVVLFALLTALC